MAKLDRPKYTLVDVVSSDCTEELNDSFGHVIGVECYEKRIGRRISFGRLSGVTFTAISVRWNKRV